MSMKVSFVDFACFKVVFVLTCDVSSIRTTATMKSMSSDATRNVLLFASNTDLNPSSLNVTET